VPGVPLTSWPISFSDIEPHMKKAEADLGFERAKCDPNLRLNDEGFSYDGEPDETLQTVLYSILDKSKIRFAQRYKAELEQLQNLDVYLNTNVTRVQVTPDGRTVQHLMCKTFKGTEFVVRAKRYVLACHGIENARLLLASDDVNPNGLGNDGDFVGRCFMEHPYAGASKLLLHNKKLFPMYLDLSNAYPKGFSACLALSEKVTEEKKCLQYYCRMRSYRTQDEVLVHQALYGLYQNRNAPLQRGDLADISRLLSDLTGTYDAIKEKLQEPDDYLLDQRIEQSPNPDSRVVLSTELDALGSRRADLDWQLSDVDVRTFQAGHEAVVARMSAMNIGRFEVEELNRSYLEKNVSGHNHHIGTTRMAEDSSTGVVDRNCKVFGVDNLYVVGSSVFCRSMFSGPTMAMLGFAYRLGDHLKI
jgi:choline dehydrogenase-like flavoprotein